MTSNRENISVAGPARLSGPDLHLMDLASTNYNDRKPELPSPTLDFFPIPGTGAWVSSGRTVEFHGSKGGTSHG